MPGNPDDDLMFEGDPEAVDDAIDAEEAATYPEDEKDDWQTETSWYNKSVK